jgi:hypothetical protein
MRRRADVDHQDPAGADPRGPRCASAAIARPAAGVPTASRSLLRSLRLRGAVKRLDAPRNGQRVGTSSSRSSFKLVGGHPRSGRTPAGRSAATFRSLQVVPHPNPGPYRAPSLPSPLLFGPATGLEETSCMRAIDACRISSTVAANALVDHPLRRAFSWRGPLGVADRRKHRVALLGVPKTGDPCEQRDREVEVADADALDTSCGSARLQREPSERLAGAMIDAKHAENSPSAIIVQPVRRNRPTSDRSRAGPNARFGTFVLVPGKGLDSAIEIV